MFCSSAQSPKVALNRCGQQWRLAGSRTLGHVKNEPDEGGRHSVLCGASSTPRSGSEQPLQLGAALCRGFIPSKSLLPHEVVTSAVQFVMALSQRLSSSRGCRSVLETRAHLRPRLWTSGCGKTPMQTLRPRRHETVTKQRECGQGNVCLYVHDHHEGACSFASPSPARSAKSDQGFCRVSQSLESQTMAALGEAIWTKNCRSVFFAFGTDRCNLGAARHRGKDGQSFSSLDFRCVDVCLGVRRPEISKWTVHPAAVTLAPGDDAVRQLPTARRHVTG